MLSFFTLLIFVSCGEGNDDEEKKIEISVTIDGEVASAAQVVLVSLDDCKILSSQLTDVNGVSVFEGLVESVKAIASKNGLRKSVILNQGDSKKKLNLDQGGADIKLVSPNLPFDSYGVGESIPFEIIINDTEDCPNLLDVSVVTSDGKVVHTTSPDVTGLVRFNTVLTEKKKYNLSIVVEDFGSLFAKLDFELFILNPAAVPITSIIADDPSGITINWNAYKDSDFASYNLYANYMTDNCDEQLGLKFQIHEQEVTSFMDHLYPLYDKVCYRMQISTTNQAYTNSDIVTVDNPIKDLIPFVASSIANSRNKVFFTTDLMTGGSVADHIVGYDLESKEFVQSDKTIFSSTYNPLLTTVNFDNTDYILSRPTTSKLNVYDQKTLKIAYTSELNEFSRFSVLSSGKIIIQSSGYNLYDIKTGAFLLSIDTPDFPFEGPLFLLNDNRVMVQDYYSNDNRLIVFTIADDYKSSSYEVITIPNVGANPSGQWLITPNKSLMVSNDGILLDISGSPYVSGRLQFEFSSWLNYSLSEDSRYVAFMLYEPNEVHVFDLSAQSLIKVIPFMDETTDIIFHTDRVGLITRRDQRIGIKFYDLL